MQDSVDAEPMDTHGLHHCVASLVLVLIPLIGVEYDRLRLLVGYNLTHSAKFGKTAIALLHLLHYSELLALLDANSIDISIRVVQGILKFHVLQNDRVEPDRELLLREVGFGKDGDFKYAFLLLDWARARAWLLLTGEKRSKLL